MNKQAETPVLFLDETNSGPSIAQPLRDAGFEVVCIQDVFPLGTNDEDWIGYVADKGWIILTKDRAQDMNDLELLLLYKHSAKKYLITGKNLKGSEIAERIISHYDKTVRTFNSQPAPFVYSIREEKVLLTLSKAKMKKRLKDRRLI